MKEKFQHVAFARSELINRFLDVRKRPVAIALNDYLRSYNDGFLFPELFDVLGPISRSTFYNWTKNFKDGGTKALIPKYSHDSVPQITYAERVCSLHFFNECRIVTKAAEKTKDFLSKNNVSSPNSAYELIRWLKKFKRENQKFLGNQET